MGSHGLPDAAEADFQQLRAEHRHWLNFNSVQLSLCLDKTVQLNIAALHTVRAQLKHSFVLRALKAAGWHGERHFLGKRWRLQSPHAVMEALCTFLPETSARQWVTDR